MTITHGLWAYAPNGTIEKTGSRPDWRVGDTPEKGAVAPDAILIREGWFPVVDGDGPFDPVTQTRSVRPFGEWVLEGKQVARTWLVEDLPEPEPTVPEAVTMRQARLALLGAGVLDAAEAAIAGMPGVEGRAAQIEWEYATELRRDHPLVAGLGQGLGLDDAAIDALFMQAAQII